MSPNEYQQLALRTAPRISESTQKLLNDGLMGLSGEDSKSVDIFKKLLLLNGLMGLSGEAGEALDILKKHLFQQHWLDRVHIAKELGDVAWYLAISADALGYKLEDIFKMNIEKLKSRYPDGFSAENSMNRKEGDI